MNTNVIERTGIMKTRAAFSKDLKKRYLLEMSWDESKPKLCIIMTYPSTADEFILDQTTMLCRNNAIRQGFGAISIVNLCACINNQSQNPDKVNSSYIMQECESANTVIVAFGRTTAFEEEKKALLDALDPYREKLFTIVDSKGMRFSHPLSPYAHEWKLERLIKG